jgi:hypothetical protein
MRRISLLIAFVALLSYARTVHAYRLDGSVYLMPIGSEPSFTSWGSAEFFDDINQTTNVPLSGTHAVTGPATFTHSVSGNGRYAYALQGPAEAGACYGTSLNVTADPDGWRGPYEGAWTGEQKCADGGSGGTVIVVGDKCDGLDGYGNPCSPIILNRGRGPWKLSGADDPVLFDINANGRRDRITWTGRGEPLAFLVLDRNGNGYVDDGRELFGTATVLASGVRAANGFDALREFDANADHVIDSRDDVWTDLLLWVDNNHDAWSQPGELEQIAKCDVVALRVDYHEARRIDAEGNLFLYGSTVRTIRGERAFYDVFFRTIE